MSMNLALIKKYLVLEICALAILAALVVIGLKLGAAMRRYNVEKRELKAAMERKDLLDRRKPYPSWENVRLETENYRDILDNYNELNENVRARQIEPQAMQAVEFMSLLEKTLRQISRQLTAARVAYPPNFKFSFERYAGGRPPSKEDVPRLVQQLKIIESLCQVLAKVGVAELVSLHREEFENDLKITRGRQAVPQSSELAGEASLYTTQHFKLTVKAHELAAMELLNLMARCPLFTVVTSLEMMNQKPVLRSETGASVPSRDVVKESVSRERAIIIGDEKVELKLALDVFRFAPSLDFREKDGGKR